MRGGRSLRGGGVALLTLALSTLGWTIVLSAPPARADCPVLDPICVVEETVDPATDEVEPVVEEEVVETVVEPVVDVVEELEDQVPQVEVPIPIEEPASTVETPDQPPRPPSDPTDPVGPGEPGADPDAPGGSTIGEADVVVVRDAAVTPDLPLGGDTSTRAAEPPSILGPGRRSFIGRVGSFGLDVAKAIAFPLLLALVVAAFVLVQDRLDRRDPRFVLAPVRPGVLRFD